MRSRCELRAGFTLVELMVAMALTLFVMVILSQAFVTSLDTFSGMKGIGDMQQNLRTATVLMRDDLGQDHFEGKRRLSDMTMTGAPLIVNQPPQAGFFLVRRPSSASTTAGAPYFFEGNDAFGLPSFRATDQMIYMTVKRKGNRQENFFNAAIQGDPVMVLPTFFAQQTSYNVPPINLPIATWAQPYQTGSGTGFYNSQWAEVLYYLIRTGTTEQPNDPSSTLGTPTYALYRAQFVMVADGTNVSNKFANTLTFNGFQLQHRLQNTTFAGMSCNPGATQLAFYSPADAALGQRVIPDLTSFNPDPNATALGARVFAGATLVLPNVISFHVQVMPLGSSSFVDASNSALAGLKGIQVTLRVWDNKTRQTRQATVVQDL